MSTVVAITGAPLPLDPAARGFALTYHPHEANRCPGCGRSHWLVGRLLAECAFCATALPIADGGMTGAGLFRLHRRTARNGSEQLAA